MFQGFQYYHHLLEFLIFSRTILSHPSYTFFQEHIWSVVHWYFKYVKFRNKVIHNVKIFNRLIGPIFHFKELFLYQLQRFIELAYQNLKRNFCIPYPKTSFSFELIWLLNKLWLIRWISFRLQEICRFSDDTLSLTFYKPLLFVIHSHLLIVQVFCMDLFFPQLFQDNISWRNLSLYHP